MERSTPAKHIEPEILVINEYIGGEESPFTFKEFKQFVLDCHIRFPDIVLAQAVEESGRFTSPIWMENNNPFGMKLATKRHTTHIGENRGHAKFKNWKMAVLDYAYLQAVFARKIKTREGYYQFLNSYAENPKYKNHLQKHLHKYQGFGISDDYLDDF